jgi:hypothetical protein
MPYLFSIFNLRSWTVLYLDIRAYGKRMGQPVVCAGDAMQQERHQTTLLKYSLTCSP